MTDGETPADAEICQSGYPVTNVAQLSHRRPSAAGAQVACPSQGWPSVAKAGSSRERRRCAWAAGRRQRPRWPRGALPCTPLLSALAHAPNPELAGAGKPSPQELPGWGVRAIRPQERSRGCSGRRHWGLRSSSVEWGCRADCCRWGGGSPCEGQEPRNWMVPGGRSSPLAWLCSWAAKPHFRPQWLGFQQHLSCGQGTGMETWF